MVRMNFILPIKKAISYQVLAAIEKTKQKNITELHESEGNKKIKLKKISFIFFSISKKLGRRVCKTKNKKTLALP